MKLTFALLTSVVVGILGGTTAEEPSPRASSVTSKAAAKKYELGPDSLPHEGVPMGKLEGPFLFRSRVLANTTRRYCVYVPAQYDPAKAACVLVFQDAPERSTPRACCGCRQ